MKSKSKKILITIAATLEAKEKEFWSSGGDL